MKSLIALAIAALAAGTLALADAPARAAPYERVPAARFDPDSEASREVAIFAGGCFWGVEGVFEKVRGVKSAVSGYAGGSAADASYERVSRGRTAHAEAVRIVFDPRVVSYADLLQVYFSVVADPTLVDRQGPDRGPHYRTALFPMTATQAKVARAYIAQLGAAGIYRRPIATRLETGKFYPAEAYHQDYMAAHPRSPYILAHDVPKVRALARLFPELAR